ncbi:MAG: ABC transporter permease [Egibacteraceae bacterium]
MLLEAVLTGAVRGGTSILWATLGETIAERAGVINLGTEGSMLGGALAAYVVTVQTANPWLGALAGVAAGAALALIFAVVVLWRGANQIATGLVITFLSLGLTSLFGQAYVGRGIEGFTAVKVPMLGSLPFVGPILFDHDPLTYLAFAAGPAVWWLLHRTRGGLRIRAAGERAEVLHAFGVSPTRVRYLAVVTGGGLAGLGGAQLSTALALNWSENMTVGRGFIAVALVIFAAWNPLKGMAGAYLFGGALALELQLQARGAQISPFFLDAVPYLTVIAVLMLLGRRRIHASPEGLSRVFDTQTTPGR